MNSYSVEENVLIQKDLSNIRALEFDGKDPSATPVYIATAGGPGTCKTTILESYLRDKTNIVYVDPDQRSLKFMIQTYWQSLSLGRVCQFPDYVTALKHAYEKWRGASNFIAYTLLNEAFEGSYNIAHGTTASSREIAQLYKGLKSKNYKIVLLLCHAAQSTRQSTLFYRLHTQGFYQVASQDIDSKTQNFLKNIDIYFEYADELHFYWSEPTAQAGAPFTSIHVASFSKEKLEVHDETKWEQWKQQYATDTGCAFPLLHQ